MRALARRLGKAALLLGLVAGVLLGAAHLPPVVRAAARAIEARAGAALDARLAIGDLDYNLLTRRVTLRQVRLAGPGPADETFFEAASIEARVPMAALGGAREIASLAIDRPLIRIDALRTWLKNRPDRAPAPPTAPFLLHHLRVSGLDLVGAETTDTGFSIDLRGVSLDSTPEGRGFVTAIAAGTGWLRAGGYRTDIREVGGTVGFDGEQVRLAPLRVTTRDHRLGATGTLTLLGRPAAWDIAFESATDVGVVLANWPSVPAGQGLSALAGSVKGPIGDPTVTVRGTMGELRLGDALLRQVEAEAVVTADGVVVPSARARTLGGSVTLGLRLSGEGDRLDAQVADLSVADALAAAGLRQPTRVDGRCTGTITFDGDLTRPWDGRAQADLRVRPAAGAAAPLVGALDLSLRGGAWRLRARDAAVGTTRLALEASGVVPAGSPSLARSTLAGTATVDIASVQSLLETMAALGVDVPAAVAGRLDGRASLPVTLGGTIGAPDLLTTFAGQTLTVAPLGPVTVEGGVGLTGGRVLELRDATATSGARRLSVRGRADLAGGPVDAEIDASGWTLSDLRGLGLRHASLPEAAALRASGRVTGTVAHPAFDGRVGARDLDWMGQRVDQVSGRLALVTRPAPARARRGTRASTTGRGPWLSLDVREVEAIAGSGRLTLNGGLRWPDGTLDLRAGATRWPLRPLRLADGTGGSRDIDVSADVDLTIDARGTIEAPVGTGRVSLAAPRYGDVRPGPIEGVVEASGDGAVTLRAAAATLSATAEARMRLAAPRAYEGRLVFADVDLGALGEAGVLPAGQRDALDGVAAGRLDAQGSLDAIEASTVVGRLDAFRGTAWGLPVALVAPAVLQLSASELSSEGIALRSGATTVTASGRIGKAEADRFSLEIDGRIRDVLPLLTRASGRGVIGDGALTATIVADGGLSAPRLRGRVALDEVHLQADRGPGLTDFALEARLEDGLIVVPRAHGLLGGDELTASAQVPLRWLRAALPGRVVAANPSSGEGAVRVEAGRVTLSTLGWLTGSPPAEDLAGDLALLADLRATDPGVAAWRGTVTVDRGRFTTSDLSVTQVGPAVIDLRDGVAQFEEWRWAGPRSDVALRGRIDVVATPVAYEVEARGPIDLAMLAPLLPGRSAGTLRLDLRATREAGQSRLFGELVLAGGTWIDRDLQVALTGATGTVRMRGDRAVFEGLTARLNGGDLAVTGAIGRGAEGRAFDGAVTLSGRGITVEYPRRVVNEVDADLLLSAPGPRGSPIGLTGKATVRPGALRASLRELAQLFAPSAPVPPTPEAERRERLLGSLGLDVAIDTADDLVASSNELRAQMGASVRLTGTLAQPGMLGRADIRDDGELFLAGRLYQLRGGRVDFVDPSRIDPRLTLLGDTTVSDYEIEMQLTGPVERLEFRLRSNPPLSQGDLASLLTTGQTLKERRENAGEASSDTARTQLLSLVSSEYLGKVGRVLGVDTVRIENTARDLSAVDLDPVARLSVTKTFAAGLELTYSQSLQENDDIAWILRYRPGWRSLEGKATFETTGGETVELRQELQFGGGYVPPARAGRRRARSETRVTEVTFSGVPDAEVADLRKRLRLRPGRRFDAFRWQQDRERIERYYRDLDRLRTTVSASHRPSEDGRSVAIAYAIERGPVVSLRVEGATLDAAGREALRAAWAESSIDLFLEEALTEAMRLALARQGLLRPAVTVRVTSAEDRTDALVSVLAGEPSASRAFAFSGNRAFPSDDLAALIAASGLGDRVWVDPRLATGPIVARYAVAGYLNVRVEAGAPVFDGPRATLPIAVREGRPFVLSDVEVKGARLIGEPEVRGAFGLESGAAYTTAAASAGTEAVRSLYARLGHADALVRQETTYDRERSTARVTLEIEEGTRRTVAGVALAGDVVTRPVLTSRALAIETGQPVDMRQVEEAQRRLYDLGVFRSVEPRFEPAGPPVTPVAGAVEQPVQVVFDVQEYARYRLRYGFQVSADTLSARELTTTGTRPGVTVDLRRSNLFGLGFDVGGGGFFTIDRSRVRGLVQSSTLGGRPVQSTLTVTRDDTEGEAGSIAVSERRTQLAAEQRWRPTRRTEFTYGYDLEYDDAELTLSLRNRDPLVLSLRARLASVNSTFSIDTRDNVVNPRRGQFHSARIELGSGWLASELPFVRYLGQHFVYVPAGRLTWASGVRFGAVAIDAARADSLESILVRFRTGGGTSVRGYRQDALTPEIVEDFPRGGDLLLVLNQEARLRLTSWFGVVGFVDAGNAFARRGDFSWSGLEVGVGTGLRLTTPVGVVRLDLGVPRPRPANHPSAIWYFSFGHAF